MKRNLQMANQSCNYWKFRIHWNELEWVNPRSHIEVKNPFFVSYGKLCLKDNNKTAHWICHSKLEPLDLEAFV